MYEQDQQEGDQDFYKRLSLSASRGVWSSYQPKERQYSTGYYQRNKLKNPNDNSFKNQRRQLIPMTPKEPRIRNVRQNQVITNLKSQLQNIKSEVAKLIKKQDDERASDAGSVRTPKNIKTANIYDKFEDNSSSSSFALRHQNRTRLSTQQNTKQKYLQLQTQSLRNQLKNLKNKYIMRKSQYKQQTQTLKKKIHLLQNVITQGEQQMTQYKIDIERQIQTIRNNMSIKQGQVNNQQLQKQYQQLRHQIIYLKKRTLQANEQIKTMAIQNNELSNQLKNNNNIDQIQSVKIQFYDIVKQKDNLIQQKQNQILNMISKQDIAHEVVKKNTQLIETLNIERQHYQRMQHTLNQKINELLVVIQQQNNSTQSQIKYQDLLNQYNQVIYQLEQSNIQKQNMSRDLSQLGLSLTELKFKNSELEQNRSSQNGYQQQCEYLQNQLNEFKSNVMEMVRETAHKINCLEQQNQTLKRCQAGGSTEDLGSQIEFLKNENQRILTFIAEQKYRLESKTDECCKLEKVIQDLQQKLENSTTSSNTLNKHDNNQQKVSSLEQELRNRQQQISLLKYDNSTFSHLLSSKCQQLQSLHLSYQAKLTQSRSKQAILQYSIKTLSSKVKQYQQVYTKTLRQTKQLLTNNVLVDNNIDQSLKIQMDSITKLRATISNKNQQIHMLQQSSCALGIVVNKLKQQLQCQRNKQSTINKTDQIKKQNKNYQQTIKCLEEKIGILLIEIQKKEEFIVNYLNTNQIDKQQVIAKFEELYNLKNWAKLNDGLKGELDKIEKLKEQNLVLIKELGRVHCGENIRTQQANCQQFSVIDSK